MKLKTEFDFDAAHRLVGYQGKCSNLHGHIWRVVVEIEGGNDDIDNVGMMWDFTNVKSIKEVFDHKTILWDCEENMQLINALEDVCGDGCMVLLDCNPTAENLCTEIIRLLKISNDRLQYKVQVYESPKSYAEVSE
jgi:6-pyruvoyltetrahydropterin/6-carboxytetrahydropterin synthase